MDLMFTVVFFFSVSTCPPPAPPPQKTTIEQQQKIPCYQYQLSKLYFSYAIVYEIMNKSFVFCK